MSADSDVYAPMGVAADYSAATATTKNFVAVANQLVKGLVVHVDDTGDTTATVWDLYVNGSDASVGFLQMLSADGGPANNRGVYAGADARHQVHAGDLLSIQPDGNDGGISPEAYCTLVMDRGNRSNGEIYAYMGFTTAYDTAVALDEKFAAPMNLKVAGLAVHYVAAPTTTATEWQLFVNGADSGCGFVGPIVHTLNTGIVLAPDSRFEVKEGDLLTIVPDGNDGGTGVDAHAQLILMR